MSGYGVNALASSDYRHYLADGVHYTVSTASEEQVLLVPYEGNDPISPSKVGSPGLTRWWWPTADWSSDQTGAPTSMTRGAELRTQV